MHKNFVDRRGDSERKVLSNNPSSSRNKLTENSISVRK